MKNGDCQRRRPPLLSGHMLIAIQCQEKNINEPLAVLLAHYAVIIPTSRQICRHALEPAK